AAAAAVGAAATAPLVFWLQTGRVPVPPRPPVPPRALPPVPPPANALPVPVENTGTFNASPPLPPVDVPARPPAPPAPPAGQFSSWADAAPASSTDAAAKSPTARSSRNPPLFLDRKFVISFPFSASAAVGCPR